MIQRLKLCHEDGLRGFVFPYGYEQVILLFDSGCALRLELIVSMRKRNYVKADRSSRRARWKAPLIAAGVLLVLYFLITRVVGEMGVVKYYRMRAQRTALTEEISKLKQDNARLRKEVFSLKNDSAYIERVARDKLGLARPGEIVYYYGEP
jgi:cell division protein FtsB